jgi:hypothetical protein
MLVDETCWFLAVDFDKEEWKENSRAYLETCETFNVSAVLERSRSGNGGHIWIFFSESGYPSSGWIWKLDCPSTAG